RENWQRLIGAQKKAIDRRSAKPVNLISLCPSWRARNAPDIGTSLPAGLANEQRFDVGEPDVVRPAIAADCRGVAAFVIRAIGQEIANPGGAHFSEGDFDWACESRHAPMIPP